VRDIIAALPPVLAGSNSAAKEAAMALMVEMTRWIGKSFYTSYGRVRRFWLKI
jgi:hypothetical protein